MMTVSKALTAEQIVKYQLQEMRNAAANYYSNGHIASRWHGTLATELGFEGPVDVTDEAVLRLANGQHPLTGETLIAWRTGAPYTDHHGDNVAPMKHRAAWDVGFAAPKSVSLVALVGGDGRLVQAHRESVDAALARLEQYMQARGGGSKPSQTTGRAAFAVFEHDSARPVDGYSAPQLHSHALLFNVTRTDDGRYRSVQPAAWFENQRLGTAIYRAELARRLSALGYDITWRQAGRQEGFVPEIKGLSQAYLDASSPRRARILTALEEAGRAGARAAQVAAIATRDPKNHAVSADEMRQRHQVIAAQFGHPQAAVIDRSWRRGVSPLPRDEQSAREAVTFAVDRNLERDAVVDERVIVRDALIRGMGRVDPDDVAREIAQRAADARLLQREMGPGAPSNGYTTPDMVATEEKIIRRVIDGRDRHPAFVVGPAVDRLLARYPKLSDAQQAVTREIVASRDTVTALQGRAGVGKTTALAAVVDGMREHGFRVQGLAPTGAAADRLSAVGIPTMTLQRYITPESLAAESPQMAVYVLDEASLASTKEIAAFWDTLRPSDRVLLVGDRAQHQSVEAGRMFEQLQEAGMRTASLDTIIRQQDPAFVAIIEHLANRNIPAALDRLDEQGRVDQIPRRAERLDAIARAYADSPHDTIVIDPVNESRAELNAAIQAELSRRRESPTSVHRTTVLVQRQEMTGPDRGWADRYDVDDVIRYVRGNRALGVRGGDYARVTATDPRENLITVRRADGEFVTYSPARLRGVTVYREEHRDLAVGDRVQFTQALKSARVRNRQLGTVAAIGPMTLRVKLDTGRSVAFNPGQYRHLDHGYAVTSYSSQSLDNDRVLVHVDVDYGGGDQRMAYVAASRARSDIRVFTNDVARLRHLLSRDRSHRQAIDAVQANRLSA